MFALGDVLERSLNIYAPAGRVMDDPGARPRPENRSVQPAHPDLVAAHDAFRFQDGDPLLACVGISIEISGVRRPKGLKVRTPQHAQQGRVGFQVLTAGGAAVEAQRDTAKQAAISFLALA